MASQQSNTTAEELLAQSPATEAVGYELRSLRRLKIHGWAKVLGNRRATDGAPTNAGAISQAKGKDMSNETTDASYHVRQYRPDYFSGFENEVVRDVPYEGILGAPWCKNFVHSDFDRFTIRPYGSNGELIIEAHFRSGKSWVVGFAVPADHPFARNWRYTGEAPT